jgi:hypothetical protein
MDNLSSRILNVSFVNSLAVNKVQESGTPDSNNASSLGQFKRFLLIFQVDIYVTSVKFQE